MCLQDVLRLCTFHPQVFAPAVPPTLCALAVLLPGESGAEWKVALDEVRIVICATSSGTPQCNQQWDTTGGTTLTQNGTLHPSHQCTAEQWT